MKTLDEWNEAASGEGFVPVREGDEILVRSPTFSAASVFIRLFGSQGAPDEDEPLRANNFIVYAPGINPLAVKSVEFDPAFGPLDYGDTEELEFGAIEDDIEVFPWLDMSLFGSVTVSFRVYEGGEHEARETKRFTRREQFTKFYDDPDPD